MAEAMGRCTTTHLRAAANELAERGVMPTAKSLAERLEVPAALVAARLEFQRGEPVWLQRARLEANNRRADSARQTDTKRFLDIAA
jgi:DNA-binding GntR family transcriptional regulator